MKIDFDNKTIEVDSVDLKHHHWTGSLNDSIRKGLKEVSDNLYLFKVELCRN